MKRWLALACALLSLATGPLVADASNCSSREVVYPSKVVAIRAEASHASATVRFTAPGERLDIISSQVRGLYCWLQVNDGWLLDSAQYLSASPDGAAAERTEQASGNCYQAENAYVTGAMNIRASATIDSPVMARAQAGESFRVTQSTRGASWCWLDIGAGWMAKTARVQSTRPVQTGAARAGAARQVEQAPQSDIDNCCFVDRKCSADHEWEAGYWAYQRNQCGVAVSQTSSTSAPTSATDASDVNNCCQVGWICQTDLQWEQGFWNYQAGQCEHRGLIIEGSDAFKSLMDRALKLLRDRSPHWYAYATEYVSKISQNWDTRIRVTSRTGQIKWGIGHGAYTGGNLEEIAAIFVHEACHVHRRRRGAFPTGKLPGETECTEMEIQALEAIGAAPYLIDSQRNLLANIHRPECQWWRNPGTSLPASCFD